MVRRPMPMDESAKRWLYKQAHKHLWRVCQWYDLDDLIQDGMMCWWKVVRRYPEVRDRPHMMRLFQTTFTNHVHALANRRTNQLDMLMDDPFPFSGDHPLRDIVGDEGDAASFAELVAHLSKVSEPARKLLALYTTDEGCRQMRTIYRRRRGGQRETTGERIARLTGEDMGYLRHGNGTRETNSQRSLRVAAADGRGDLEKHLRDA